VPYANFQRGGLQEAYPFPPSAAHHKPIFRLRVTGVIGMQQGSGVASGTISGTAQVNGAGVAGTHVLLIAEPSGRFLAAGKTTTGGAYSFAGLAPGNYAVVVLDAAGNYRGKVIHTVVP
jgi:hypothetical protein